MKVNKFHWIIPFLLQYTQCSFIAGLLGDISDKTPGLEKNIELFLLVTAGLFIGVLGVRYLRMSVFLVISMALDSTFNEICEYLRNSYEQKKDLFNMFSYEHFESIILAIREHPNWKAIIFVIISLVISSFIVSIIHGINILGFFLASLYIYKEIFGSKRLVSVGLNDNLYLNITIYLVSLYILWIFFKRVPKIVFAAFFSFVGPLLFVSGIELGFGFEWGFSKIIQNWKAPVYYKEALGQNVTFFFVCGACFIIQLSTNRKSK